MNRCVVIKLGGGVLTDLTEAGPRLDAGLAAGLAAEIAASKAPMVIVVHGTGAFGKPPAKRHGYLGGHLPRRAAGLVSDVSADLERMGAKLVTTIREAGMAAIPLHPQHLFRYRGRELHLRDAGSVGALLDRGIVPVIGGSFVIDELDGFAVCSSDDIAARLAVALGASSLVFATRAAGVYKDFGISEEIHHALHADDATALARIAASADDVSGGMPAKLKAAFTAAARGIDTFIIDGRIAGNLAAALRHRPLSGTRLLADGPFHPAWVAAAEPAVP